VRPALLLLLAVAIVAAGGYALCAALGWPVHPSRVIVAAATALIAGGAAFVPLVLARGASQAAVAQASLVGTVIHLFGCLAGATTLLLVVQAGAGAAYWVLAFYWATLVVLVIEFSRAVRRAPVATPPPAQVTGQALGKP
jgi:hypothetical protein